MGLFSNRVEEEELKEGDHIYSWRIAYSYAHHGIYAGEGSVIHFTRGRDRELGVGNSLDALFSSSSSKPAQIEGFPCLDCGCTSLSHGVLETCMSCFLSGGQLYRFQYGADWGVFLAKLRGGTCTMAKCDRNEAVLHRARYLLREGFGKYSLFENNCEDFCLYCKTELLVVDKSKLGRSGQCASLFSGPVSAVLSGPLALAAGPITIAAVAAGLYCAARYAHDIGVRHDVVKMKVEDLAMTLQLATNSCAQEEKVVRRMLGD